MVRPEVVSEPVECLDPAATDALLAEAVERRAEVTFYKDAGCSRAVLRASLSGRTRQYLELLGPACDRAEPSGGPRELTCAVMVVDQCRYTFMGVLDPLGRRQGRSHWRIETPSDIRPLIRRFPRLRPMTSTVVTVRPIHGPDVAVAAALLNVSEGGMACRLPSSADDGITRDRMVQLTFRLPQCDEPFELAADVVHRQPAGTDGFDIVGLQFCQRRSTSDALVRLARTLARMSS